MVKSDFIPATPLRVLQIIPRLDGGGAEMATLEITRALAKAGGWSYVVTQGGRLESKIIAAGGEVFHLPVASKNPFIMVQNIGRLKKLCHAMNVDLIHARSRAPAWSAYYAAKQLGIPFVTTYHSKVPTAPRLKVFYNSIMTRGTAVIANSQFTAEQIATVHQTNPSKIHIVPRGCDTSLFDPNLFDAKSIKATRAGWQVDDKHTVFLCPARLTAWKGQDLALEAFGQLLKDFPRARVKLIFIGDDQGRAKYRKKLESMITEQGLTGQIVFVGHVTNMLQVYAAGDFVVLPSRRPEPFGRTAIEAQAAGVPVIAADAGGFRETVRMTSEGMKQGWRVTPNDALALARALGEAMNSSVTQRSAMGAMARDYVADNFTLAHMCSQTLQIYQSVIEIHGAG